jgi:tetratricopeptide (TPR) repeat protein
MNNDRLALLLQYYAEDPEDPFNLYALATEYKKEEPLKALSYFERLVEKHPDYVPTYYHLALLYIEMDEVEKAKNVFEQGIEKATALNEAMLLRELKSAYDEFMMDY